MIIGFQVAAIAEMGPSTNKTDRYSVERGAGIAAVEIPRTGEYRENRVNRLVLIVLYTVIVELTRTIPKTGGCAGNKMIRVMVRIDPIIVTLRVTLKTVAIIVFANATTAGPEIDVKQEYLRKVSVHPTNAKMKDAASLLPGCAPWVQQKMDADQKTVGPVQHVPSIAIPEFAVVVEICLSVILVNCVQDREKVIAQFHVR